MTQPSPSSWVTPEAISGPAPGIEFASPGERLIAYIIDLVVQAALLLGVTLGSIAVAIIAWPLFLFGLLAGFAISVGYFPYFWAKSGQTPGMKMMRIKVVHDSDGGPLTQGEAILRLIGFWVAATVFYIGFIWIFIDKRRRGWADLIAGTVVITAP
ncbi:MAG: RDD family protein [Chloroflexota bacterium]